jgi:hypothetical protein
LKGTAQVVSSKDNHAWCIVDGEHRSPTKSRGNNQCPGAGRDIEDTGAPSNTFHPIQGYGCDLPGIPIAVTSHMGKIIRHVWVIERRCCLRDPTRSRTGPNTFE